MTTGSGTNFIGFCSGMKRSGKSHLLAMLATRFPRRIIFDFIGEFEGRISGAYECETIESACDALLRARDRGNTWTVVATIPPKDVAELIGYVAAKRRGFARAVGGIVLECGEADLIAPNNAGIPQEVFNVFARGRHLGVSALMATQRPRAVHRIVTSQSDMIAAFRQHELLDVDYLTEVMGASAKAKILTLKQHEYVRYLPNYGKLDTVGADGRVRP